MNKDQAKGASKVALGKVQHKTGKLIGSRRQQARGIARQVEGVVQRRVGDVKEALEPRKGSSRRRARAR